MSYICKQKGRNLEVLEKYRNDKRYFGMRNFFKCKSIFGLDFLFDEIPNKLIPFDMDTYQNYTGKILVGVTNAVTGETEYLDGKDLDEKTRLLRATCALPVFFPTIKINGNTYYDGGICDPIPIKKSIEDGNDKNLIILTRPESYRKSLSKKNVIASKLVCRKYPKLKTPLLTRHNSYNETVRFCEELERQGKAIIIRPTEEGAIESFEKDINKLKAGYELGYKMCTDRIEDIKLLFK